METVLGLLVLLSASCHGLGSICDATQNATCYGALGGPVYLQLIGNGRGYEVKLYNGSNVICIFKQMKTVFYNEWNTTSVRQRWQFVPDNGTLIINPAEKNETGTYRVEITDVSTGRGLGGDHRVHLIIEVVSVVSTPVPITSPNHTLSSHTAKQQAQNVIYVSSFLVVTLVCLCLVVGMLYIWRNRRSTHTPVKEDREDVVYVQVTTSSNGRGSKAVIQGIQDKEAQDVVYSDVAMANRQSRRKSRKPPAAEAYGLEYAEVSAFCTRRPPARTHTPSQVVEYGEVRVYTPPQPNTHTHTPAQ